MYKTFTVCMVLLNYLLVVVVTNITTANALKYTPSFTAGKPYVHSPDCQQKNYLQLDCFEACHDTEQVAIPETPVNPYLFLLANGLDFHQNLPGQFTYGHSFFFRSSTFPHPHFFISPGFTAIFAPPPLLG